MRRGGHQDRRHCGRGPRQNERIGGSYEALFSRRAMKFRSMGLADKTLTEQDYRQLILDEYTFLKRRCFCLTTRYAQVRRRLRGSGAAALKG